jgi:hypothetical protein
MTGDRREKIMVTMKSTETWEIIEGKMLELRILTNANWKNTEWELAALGERILRTVETSKAESEKMRADFEILEKSLDDLNKESQYRSIFKGNIGDK